MIGDPAARLESLPSNFPVTVASLHRVAERILAPAQKPDNEIALQATPGGFGTPTFEFGGAQHQVRVEGTELAHRVDADERRTALTTLAEAGRLVAELLPPRAELGDGALNIDPAAAQGLADWYALGASVLARLVADAAPTDGPTPIRLWPEHFDIAIELGNDATGERANYGLSPGDEHHPEPYAYVGPWTAEVSGELWQATGFSGAELTHAELLAATDQHAVALDFFRSRKDALRATSRSAT